MADDDKATVSEAKPIVIKHQFVEAKDGRPTGMVSEPMTLEEVRMGKPLQWRRARPGETGGPAPDEEKMDFMD